MFWLSLWLTWSSWQGLLINTLGVILLIRLSHLPLKIFKSSLYAFFLLSLFYIVMSSWNLNPNEPFWQGHWSLAGIGATGIILWRIALLFILTRLFAAITPPMEQGVGIAYFFTPLIKIFPKVADFVLILTLTLRFVPLLVEEAQLLGKATILKGAWPKSRLRKVIEVSRLIPPLLLLSLRRADELAENLLARGYTSGIYRSISFGEWTCFDQKGLIILILWPVILWGGERIINFLLMF